MSGSRLETMIEHTVQSSQRYSQDTGYVSAHKQSGEPQSPYAALRYSQSVTSDSKYMTSNKSKQL